MSLKVPGRAASGSETDEHDMSRRSSWADVFIDTIKPAKRMSALPEYEFDRDFLASPPFSPVKGEHFSFPAMAPPQEAQQGATWSSWLGDFMATVTKSGEQMDSYGKMQTDLARASTLDKGKGRSRAESSVVTTPIESQPSLLDGLMKRAEHAISALIDAQEPASPKDVDLPRLMREMKQSDQGTSKANSSSLA
jgi:hypothetical protein